MLLVWSLLVVGHFLTTDGVPVTSDAGDLCALPEADTDQLPASCNFNNGLCGYTFPSVLWTIHTESFGSLIYGPIAGDDQGGQNQTFALFQSSDSNLNESVVMTSKIVSPVVKVGRVCLKFWYLMPNQNSKLEVYTTRLSDNVKTLIYTYSYQSTSRWEQVKVPIDESGPFTLQFESVKENNYGYVGVDNIQLVIKKVITTIVITTTTTPVTTTTIPTTTTTTAVKTTTKQPTTLLQKLTSFEETTPEIVTTTTSEMTTTTTAATTTAPTKVPTTTTMMTTTTEQETTTLFDDPTTECVCNCPRVPTVCTSDLQSTVPPPPTLCDMPEDRLFVMDRYSCDFDNDLCGYDLSIYPHLWEKYSYLYGNPTVGQIQGDHSPEGAGSYMVFNTYNTHVQNNTRHYLTSPQLLPSVDYCMSFWYNMPTNQSALEIFIETSSARKLVWLASDATNGWNQVKIAILQTEPFEVHFVGSKNTELGFFGIDDVTFSILRPRLRRSALTSSISQNMSSGCHCDCPLVHAVDCDVTTPVTPKAPLHSCRELTNTHLMTTMSCTFDDENACSYQIPVYPHLWELVRYTYGNASVGLIPRDSSSLDGYGMYAVFITDNFHVPNGEKGEILSSTVRGQGQMCLSFMYYMPTKSATLSVYALTTAHRRVLWETTKEQTSEWTEAAVVLNLNETFQIAFSSTKTSLDGYFGIDDIRLYSI